MAEADTASARKQKKPPQGGFFVSWRKRGGRLRALRVRFEGLRLQAQPSPNRPFAGRAAGSVARRGRALQSGETRSICLCVFSDLKGRRQLGTSNPLAAEKRNT